MKWLKNIFWINLDKMRENKEERDSDREEKRQCESEIKVEMFLKTQGLNNKFRYKKESISYLINTNILKWFAIYPSLLLVFFSLL